MILSDIDFLEEMYDFSLDDNLLKNASKFLQELKSISETTVPRRTLILQEGMLQTAYEFVANIIRRIFQAIKNFIEMVVEKVRRLFKQKKSTAYVDVKFKEKPLAPVRVIRPDGSQRMVNEFRSKLAQASAIYEMYAPMGDAGKEGGMHAFASSFDDSDEFFESVLYNVMERADDLAGYEIFDRNANALKEMIAIEREFHVALEDAKKSGNEVRVQAVGKLAARFNQNVQYLAKNIVAIQRYGIFSDNFSAYASKHITVLRASSGGGGYYLNKPGVTLEDNIRFELNPGRELSGSAVLKDEMTKSLLENKYRMWGVSGSMSNSVVLFQYNLTDVRLYHSGDAGSRILPDNTLRGRTNAFDLSTDEGMLNHIKLITDDLTKGGQYSECFIKNGAKPITVFVMSTDRVKEVASAVKAAGSHVPVMVVPDRMH